ncbi:hypothetical protein GXW78_26075 [Roseomonas terrae]|uniref:Lysozyme inhibitor LprI N-terminal domain-containing protein n=1 Tax=Neoroseomonas terrae TaxID=424799 RepID=A0ABS5EQ45_9PROT|nr:hypothetical protein [Neoroseomonas terrae]MBR0653151.1 hypothetical protein [Neoroseomonas terrae]
MRVLPTLCLLLATTMPVAAQDARPTPDTPVTLGTVTCAQARASRLTPRHLAAAELGAQAARAGRSRYSTAAVDAAEAALRRDCTGDAAAERRVTDIIRALPATAAAATDIDLATMTCQNLAPVWRDGARNLVPFMVGWRDGVAGTITRAALDKVGEGVPRLCRDQTNQDRRISEVLAELR